MSTLIYIELKKYIDESNYICPMQTKWLELYNLLVKIPQQNSEYKLEIPLIRSHWDSPNITKSRRFLDQLEYAFKNGFIDQLDKYLRSLEDKDWLQD